MITGIYFQVALSTIIQLFHQSKKIKNPNKYHIIEEGMKKTYDKIKSDDVEESNDENNVTLNWQNQRKFRTYILIIFIII